MERIDPSSFKGPRAYFTNFDNRIVSRVRNHDNFRKDIERKLKFLLLTKNTVVCAASHLTSEFSYRLFRDNPILLSKGLIVPALRQDKKDISELFIEKKLPTALKNEMISFYANEILKTVNWELDDNSKWFRDSFLRELKDNKSVLRRNLSKLTAKEIEFTIKEIEKDPLLERNKIDQLATRLGREESRVLKIFRELLYHISGARVVNCESTLPQENYIDYSLADIERRQIALSELQIFWKIFLELAFETLLKTAIPLDLLDILSFEDIRSLRKPIENSSFMGRYDEIVKRSVDSINRNNPNRILYDVEELMTIKESISNEFDSILKRELPIFLKRKVVRGFNVLGKNSISVGLGVVGFLPVLSSVSAVGGLLLEGRSFLFNLSQSIRNRKALKDYQQYIHRKEAALKHAIEKSEISEKSALLDFVRLLMETIGEKITL